jgi:hypothetical protein
MIPFIKGKWHVWQLPAERVMLSDEEAKKLRQFDNVDECINWLFLEGEKEAARALNKHAKGD